MVNTWDILKIRLNQIKEVKQKLLTVQGWLACLSLLDCRLDSCLHTVKMSLLSSNLVRVLVSPTVLTSAACHDQFSSGLPSINHSLRVVTHNKILLSP